MSLIDKECNVHKINNDRSRSDNLFVTICTCMYYPTITLVSYILIKFPEIKFDVNMELVELEFSEIEKKLIMAKSIDHYDHDKTSYKGLLSHHLLNPYKIRNYLFIIYMID